MIHFTRIPRRGQSINLQNFWWKLDENERNGSANVYCTCFSPLWSMYAVDLSFHYMSSDGNPPEHYPGSTAYISWNFHKYPRWLSARTAQRSRHLLLCWCNSQGAARSNSVSPSKILEKKMRTIKTILSRSSTNDERKTPPVLTSIGGHRSGRCASYWNTFLFILKWKVKMSFRLSVRVYVFIGCWQVASYSYWSESMWLVCL